MRHQVAPTRCVAVLQCALLAALVTACGGSGGADSPSQTSAPGSPVAPTLSGISPSTGTAGSAASVTLTGTNFAAGATTVSVDGVGVTVGTVTTASTTSLTTTFTIASGAAAGARNVTVTTAGGTSGALAFIVNASTPAPTLATLTPSAGVQGTNVAVTLSGTGFVTGATNVAIAGAGISVSNTAVTGTTSLTTIVAVAASATLGAHNVSVTTTGGTSAALSFTVNPPPPTFSSITPGSGVQGTALAVTLVGTNFVPGATTITTSGSGIAVSNISVVNSTSLTATFVVAANAVLGAHDVTVSTAGGVTSPGSFTVLPPPPTLTSITPASGVQGSQVAVSLSGTNFIAGGTTVSVSGDPDVVVSNVSVVNGTALTANFALSQFATPGVRAVSVTTAGGTGGGQNFTVTAFPAPVITSLTVVGACGAPFQTVMWTSDNATSASIRLAYPAAPAVTQSVATSGSLAYSNGAPTCGGSITLTVTGPGGTAQLTISM